MPEVKRVSQTDCQPLEGLIEVSKAQPGQIPWSPNTAYKLRAQKRYPDVLIKVCNKVFFDDKAWQRRVKQARKQQVEESQRIHRAVNE